MDKSPNMIEDLFKEILSRGLASALLMHHVIIMDAKAKMLPLFFPALLFLLLCAIMYSSR